MKITQIEKDWEAVSKHMGNREPLYIILDNGKFAKPRYEVGSVYNCQLSTIFEGIKDPAYAFVLIDRKEGE